MKWKRTTKVAQGNKMQWMMIEYNNNNNETFIKKKQKINNCVCFLIRTFPLSPWLIRFPEELKKKQIKSLKQKNPTKKTTSKS